MTASRRNFRFIYMLPSVHFCLWLLAYLGTLPKGWHPLDRIGVVLAIVDFPVSIIAIPLAWVLPEAVEIVGFGLLGTMWWFYLGRKADLWTARRRNRSLTNDANR